MRVLFVLAAIAALPALHAAQLSSCTPDLTTCSIYEEGVISLPFIAIAGDVVLLNADSSVSDVFRIFNDLVDTGGGTGLGISAELFSDDEFNLPSPDTYSVNVTFLQEGPIINAEDLSETDYFGNGTLYQLFSQEIPEPSTMGLLGTGLMAIAWRVRRRLRSR